MKELTHICGACGAEESLHSVLGRMVDDDQVRRLIADVVTVSLPLGALVIRYLQLFKPAKQKLRMARVREVLAELLPDIQRSTIERNGRIWPAGPDAWKAALQAVFDAQEKETLVLPLSGNGYLYQVLMRMADRVEAQAERQVDQDRRHRAAGDERGQDTGRPVALPAIDTTPRPRVDSPLVRRLKAELAAGRNAPLEPTE